MAFTVSGLSAYTDQTSKELLVATQFGTQTASLPGLTKQVGVKSSAALQLLASDAIPQDGSSCGFNPSGNTTFTQGTLTVKAVKFESSLCPRALESKWTQMLVEKGSELEIGSVAQAVWDEILATAKKRLETADWTGDTTSGSSYLNVYDGLIKKLNAASPVTATASTYNSTNARAIVKNIISNIPAALKGNPDVKIFMGYDAAEIYRQALMDANLYHVAADSNMENLQAEGSVHKIVPVHGLDGLYSTSGQSCIYAFNPKNIHFGCDMLDEEDSIKMWYSQDQDLVYYSIRFKRGWAVAYGAGVVKYANS